MHRRTGTNIHLPSGEVIRSAREADHSEGVLASGRRYYVAPGSYLVEFQIDVDGCESQGDVAMVDIALHGGRQILASGHVPSTFSEEKKVIYIDIDDYIAIEPRVYYKGCGNIVLRKIRISKINYK